MSNGFESIPGCLGLFESPIPPNGPCETCPLRDVCRYVARNFVSRRTVLERLSKIEAILKE